MITKSGYWIMILKSRYWIRILKSRYWIMILKSRYWVMILKSRHWIMILKSRYWIRILKSGYWIMILKTQHAIVGKSWSCLPSLIQWLMLISGWSCLSKGACTPCPLGCIKPKQFHSNTDHFIIYVMYKPINFFGLKAGQSSHDFAICFKLAQFWSLIVRFPCISFLWIKIGAKCN